MAKGKRTGFRAWEDADIIQLIELRNGGRSWKEVAEEMGDRSKSAAQQMACNLRKAGYEDKIMRGSAKKKRPLKFLDRLPAYKK